MWGINPPWLIIIPYILTQPRCLKEAIITRFAGKEGLIELQGPGVAPVVVSYLSTWSLSAAKDKIDVSAMSDTNQSRVLGLPDMTGSFDFFWDDSQMIIQAAAEYLTAAYTLAIYPNGQIATTHSWVGPVWLDYDVSGGVKDAVKGKCNWVAAGTIVRT